MRKLFLISSLLIMSMFTLTACGKSNEDINVGTGTDATETNSTETDAKYTLTDDEANAFADSFGDAPSVTAVNTESDDATEATTTETTTTSDTDKPADSSCNHNWVSTQVLVKDAWTETVVDVPEKTEKVLVRDAWDETKKVKVKDEWDEQVYVCTHQMQLDTGEYLDTVEATKAFCQAHNCVSHSREALDRYNEDPSVGPGLCGCRVTPVDEYKTVHHDAEYETQTIHHDAEYKTVTTPAQTHTVNHPAEYKTVKKCSECGAQK